MHERELKRMIPTVLTGRFDIGAFRHRLDLMVADGCITDAEREDYLNQIAHALTTPARGRARASLAWDATKARVRGLFKR